jgi:hypothetical protein
MSQRYPDINSPQFGQQARSAIVGLVLAHLPLGSDGRKIDDRLAWDILCYASVKRISIESACMELAGAPSGNTTREHLDAALDPSRAEGVQYFAYAVYGLGPIEAHQLFELYRRRFGIETSYRQLHQVRARTSSRNPALRLLLVGLALLIVNLWVLLRRTWVQTTRYGGRVRIVELTLERVADA